MVKIKTKTVPTAVLTGRALDWAVAKCVGGYDLTPGPRMLALYDRWDGSGVPVGFFSPSTDWSHAWRILEREHIDIRYTFTKDGYRTAQSVDAVEAKIYLPNGATVFDPTKTVGEYGPTPLIAAMRCYVMCHMGDSVEVPAEILNKGR